MSLNSTSLHQLLEGYEWFMRESKLTVNVDVDLSHINKFQQIVIVKVNGEWVAIGVGPGMTEREIWEQVKRFEG